jgi:hypothetical protein
MHFRKRRKPTFFYVDLEVNRVRFSLRLVDITPEGAKLQGNHNVVDGTEGIITVRGHGLPGTLKWVEGEKIGFEFEKPVAPRLYAVLAHEKAEHAKRRFLAG